MFSLNGKTALVTGASGGIGSDIARALHKQGATVTLSGTRQEALDKLKDELGDRAHVAVCNLGDGAQGVGPVVRRDDDGNPHQRFRLGGTGGSWVNPCMRSAYFA